MFTVRDLWNTRLLHLRLAASMTNQLSSNSLTVPIVELILQRHLLNTNMLSLRSKRRPRILVIKETRLKWSFCEQPAAKHQVTLFRIIMITILIFYVEHVIKGKFSCSQKGFRTWHKNFLMDLLLELVGITPKRTVQLTHQRFYKVCQRRYRSNQNHPVWK